MLRKYADPCLTCALSQRSAMFPVHAYTDDQQGMLNETLSGKQVAEVGSKANPLFTDP